jgi:hypothetical protein
MLTFILAAILSLVLVVLVAQITSRRTDPHHSFAVALMNNHLGETSKAIRHDGDAKHSSDWLATNSLFRRRRLT